MLLCRPWDQQLLDEGAGLGCDVGMSGIGLDQQGVFVLMQIVRAHVHIEPAGNAVEDKSKGDTIPLISVEYDSNIVEKKCKLVKKEDVIRYYDDWNKPRPYFC